MTSDENLLSSHKRSVITPRKGKSMEKSVHFATILVSSYHDPCTVNGQCGWYTSKELGVIRNDIQRVVDAEKNRKPCSNNTQDEGICLRGLEIFLSNVRKDLQKHFARSILEAQRRIKMAKVAVADVDVVEGREDDDVLLRNVAEKYSQYARDRAYQIAVKDRDECRSLNPGHTRMQQALALPSHKKRVLSDNSPRIGRKRAGLPPRNVLLQIGRN
jgi:hypothetical protein